MSHACARPFVIAFCPERFVWVAGGRLASGQFVECKGDTPAEAEGEVQRLVHRLGEELHLRFRLEPAAPGAPAHVRRLRWALERPHAIRHTALALHLAMVSAVYLAVWTDPSCGMLPMLLFPFYLPVVLLCFLFCSASGSLAEGVWVLLAGAAWVFLVGSVLDRRLQRHWSEAYGRLALESLARMAAFRAPTKARGE